MSARTRLRTFASDVRKLVYPPAWGKKSYSQEGEDLLVGELLARIHKGFYVDVGCHHPHRFSNTYRLYRRGWSGLCIDPLPGVKRAFARHRRRDVVVEVGISAAQGQLEYIMFNEPALNSFDPDTARSYEQMDDYCIERRVQVPTLPLREVLASSRVGKIDFMTIDVEGFDLEVIDSNDWTRWRPSVLVVECHARRIEDVLDNPIYQRMQLLGYEAVQKTLRNVIFLDKTGE